MWQNCCVVVGLNKMSYLFRKWHNEQFHQHMHLSVADFVLFFNFHVLLGLDDVLNEYSWRKWMKHHIVPTEQFQSLSFTRCTMNNVVSDNNLENTSSLFYNAVDSPCNVYRPNYSFVSRIKPIKINKRWEHSNLCCFYSTGQPNYADMYSQSSSAICFHLPLQIFFFLLIHSTIKHRWLIFCSAADVASHQLFLDAKTKT